MSEEKRHKILALCSGGFDSVVMVHDLLKKHDIDNIYLLRFSYGQRNDVAEQECFTRLINKFEIPLSQACNMTLPPFSWSNSSICLASNNARGYDLESQYLPMRNLIFLSYALSFAESMECTKVYSAILAGGIYSDTCIDFLTSIKRVAKVAGIAIKFPFSNKTKDDLIKKAKHYRLGVDDFYSCNVGRRIPCGKCSDCIDIKRVLSIISK